MRGLTDSLTLRGRCFLAAGTALLVCGIVLGFEDITRLGVLVAGLPIIVGLFTSHRRVRLHTERIVIPGRVAIDEASDVVLVVVNEGVLSTPILMAEEQLTYALGDRPRFVIPKMGPGERHQLPYRVRSSVRGRHGLGPLSLRIKDPFALTLRLSSVAGAGELIVLPKVVDLTQAEATSGIGSEGAVPHMVALHGEDDVSVRNYRDGDDLRRIHWPATARTGELMVRQEDRPARRRALVVLDDRRVTPSGDRTSASFEWAVTAAASLVALFVGRGLATHLVLAGSPVDTPTGEPLGLDAALSALAVAELEEPEILEHSLDAATAIAMDGALVAAVTGPLEEPDAIRLASCRSPGSSAVALVLDLGRPMTPGGSTAEMTADFLVTRGWACVIVPDGMSVSQAWNSVSPGLTGARR